jgi:hypothetical protein
MQVVVRLIVRLWYGSDSPRGFENTPEKRTRLNCGIQRDLTQTEAIDLYIEYASRPEVLSDFQHFSRNWRIAWTFPIHSYN